MFSGGTEKEIKRRKEALKNKAESDVVPSNRTQENNGAQTSRDDQISSGMINHTMSWLQRKVLKKGLETTQQQGNDSTIPEEFVDRSSEVQDVISHSNSQNICEWISQIFSKSPDSPAQCAASTANESEMGVPGKGSLNNAAFAIKSQLIQAIVGGIRRVSSERDRDEIIRWFVNARQILVQEQPKQEIVKALYGSLDTKRFAQLLGNTIVISVREYKGANLPLSLKVALPVTIVGAGFLGVKGAGVAAFGGAIGLPVVLLLFLGAAGATAIVEAFVKDRSVRDPLTKLLLMLVALETARRARKDFVDALRAEATLPKRADCPDEENALIEYLAQMDPIVFERHVMSFFEEDGYPVGVTQRSNDFGVDGYILHPDGVIVVQCKRYRLDNPVGRPAVQQFKGVIEEQAALKGYFITSSRFTGEAIESATKSSRLVLVDGTELVRWHRGGRNAV